MSTMVKFFGHGVVLNNGRGRLCKFENGEFSTNKPETIAKLKALGYLCDELSAVEPKKHKKAVKKK